MLKYKITAVDSFTFGEVTYEESLSFENYQIMTRIMNTKATVILDKLPCGTVSRGRITKIEKVPTEGTRVQVEVGGLWYSSVRFESKEEANDFMTINPEYGVIKVYNTTVWVASNDDKGREAPRNYTGEVSNDH